MIYQVERLDKKYMVDLFYKMNKGSIPLKDIEYIGDRCHVKVGCINQNYDYVLVWNNGCVEVEGCPVLDINQLYFELCNKMRACENCKHYVADSYECKLVGETCLSSEEEYPDKDKVSQFIDDHDIDISFVVSEHETRQVSGFFPSTDIEESVAISFGRDFCCKHHEFKEDK
jgi:hypothetical protein